MLVRIAQNLYWTGRYIKRASHLAKYLRVQYFSTLDASMIYNLDFTLRSILNMSGMEYEATIPLEEEDVLMKVGFDANNPASIYSTIVSARENARSIRHIISSELWESINRWYHFNRSFSQDYYKKQGLYEYTTQVEQHSKIIESDIQSTLFRNDEYYFLVVGVLLENTIQIARILRSKLIDTEILSENGENIPLMHYQWTITLKALESFDMHNEYYHNAISTKSIVDFLVASPHLPRSLYYNMKKLNRSFQKISIKPDGFELFLFELAKMESQLRFFEYVSNEQLHDFLDNIMNRLLEIHVICNRLYFNKPTIKQKE